MRFRQFEDPFYKNQPNSDFVNILNSPVHTQKPYNWNKRNVNNDEIFIKSLNIVKKFPDEEGLLESSYNDFLDFMAVTEISSSKTGTVLETKKAKTPCFEAYKIEVTKEKITISANDTEGIRRAFIYIEDEMKRRNGSILPIGTIERKPFVKSRISRCYFSPPSHSCEHDDTNELADNVDYYNENYLNRLMHDGINGLWLGAHFRDILTSTIIPEYGSDAERRIKKLNRVVEKCRRYGIGIYLFVEEPASSYLNPTFVAHTELHSDGGAKLFCPSKKACEDYIREAITQLFENVPHLKGIIDITVGEAQTGCGSTEHTLDCKRCREKFGTIGKTLAATEKMIADAMHEVNPDAEFISWTYAQRNWDFDDVRDACRNRDTKVIHMENFEDHGDPIQLGKERLAFDYWLSYAGPGKLMKTAVEENKKRGVRTYAKIQACSSHEISTVPYVPVPGILYDKYKYMHENDISGVVQCWYFGNYPCLMNKAACELAFEPFFDTKEEFLNHIAGAYWGEDAKKASEAYALFEKGYINFPCSVSFEWFGPMQDSPCSPLRLKPIDLHMTETWLCKSMPGGDRIGEAFRDGHTMDEVIELLYRMSKYCGEGANVFNSIDSGDKYERQEQKSVAAAISVLFQSGYNIVRFYSLRRKLGILEGDALSILDEMEKIVQEEKELSAKLEKLCVEDGRLGFHSEAYGYKFFPEKLRWRIAELDKLLKTEFSEVRQRIAENKVPLEFYFAEHEEARAYQIADNDIDKAETMNFLTSEGKESEFTTVSAVEKDGVITLKFTLNDSENDELRFRPEFRMFEPTVPFSLVNGKLDMKDSFEYSFFGERANEKRKNLRYTFQKGDGFECYTLTFRREDFDIGEYETFRFSIKRIGKHNECIALPDRMYSQLIDDIFSPDEYAFFLPNRNL